MGGAFSFRAIFSLADGAAPATARDAADGRHGNRPGCGCRPSLHPHAMRRPGAAYTNATSRICARMILAIIAIGYTVV